MGKRTKQLLYLIILLLVFFLNYSCDNKYGVEIESQPVHQHQWIGLGGGIRDCGSGGKYFYALSVKPEIFDVWQWNDDNVEKYKCIELKNTFAFAFLSSDKYLCCHIYEELREIKEIQLLIFDSNKLISEYQLERGWYCDKISPSRNENYLAVGINEDSTYDPEGYDRKRPRYRIGVMDPNQDGIHWLPELAERNPDGSTIVSEVAVSDDGKYAAVSGWVNGAAAFDVKNRKILWQKNWRQLKDIRLNDITFSPDSKYVYTGGGGGCVYKIETQTGNVVGRWYATPSGEPEYAHRIYSVAASSDGRFVAASLKPTGLTCIWYADTGKIAKVVNHGGGAMMIMFSPNSKVLATMGGGAIKIWKMPE
jgi:WD40 repeat protein